MPPALVTAYYAEWTRGKLDIAAEYWRSPLEPVANVGGTIVPIPLDQRTWDPMISYRLTRKLQVGTYYSWYIDKALDTSQPANYQKDWAISGRYDFNQYFYGKLEGHFQHGNGLGYYASVNPNGLKPNSNMLAARVGFTF